MEILGYILAVLIGISLGLIGGGGSILTVPVLVYLFHLDPLIATTYSLFIVGFTSLAGGVKSYVNKTIDFRSVSLFGIPSILAIYVARHFLLPAIPPAIFGIEKGSFLMMVFALLMLVASISMMASKREEAYAAVRRKSRDRTLPLLLPGLVVGLVTGLLGAGGGFLIIPVLVVVIKLPMKRAVGTSLMIIAINSIFGFVFSIHQQALDWNLMLIFTVLAIAGVFIGSRLARHIDGNTLKKGFGWFVLVMGIYILVREITSRP
ncbi:MAG: sulfite exporter TauE/SafE family protein [Gemmatimonadaceae bacterium]|nr:sulfite exporter TauE/SafE family protein [Chitinophagaceae bacterium]